MNKGLRIHLSIVLSLLIFFIQQSCIYMNRGSKEPDKMGEYVFSIMRNLSKLSKQEYIDKHITLAEAKVIGKNSTLVPDPEIRNEIESATEEEIWDEILEYYNHNKDWAGENGIVWKKIKYLDFTYEIFYDEIVSLEGTLYFKYGEKSYSVDFYSIYDGIYYRLVAIDSLSTNKRSSR